MDGGRNIKADQKTPTSSTAGELHLLPISGDALSRLIVLADAGIYPITV